MIKKLFIYSIMLSMTLHCASRLGIIDHLYQKRHSIAHTIGLISEIPIAMCNSDYSKDQTLVIEVADDSDAVPVSTTQAGEINLFFVLVPRFSCVDTGVRRSSAFHTRADLYDLTPVQSIFHPPAG